MKGIVILSRLVYLRGFRKENRLLKYIVINIMIKMCFRSYGNFSLDWKEKKFFKRCDIRVEF